MIIRGIRGPNHHMLEEIFVEGNVIYVVFLAIAIIAFHLKKVWLRYVVMLASLALIGFLQMGCPSPVRAIQNVAADPGQLSAIIPFLAKIGIVLVVAFFYGKIFCGWVCPKGSIQEFLYQRKLKINVPSGLDKWLRKLKYIMLVLIIVLPVFFHYKPFNPDTSPFAALFNLGGGTVAIALLGIILVSSIFIYRPFCRYACPTGALLGIVAYLNRNRFFTENCTCCQLACKNCEIGAFQCPTKDGERQFSVDKSECIMCGECRGNCPKGISFNLFKKEVVS